MLALVALAVQLVGWYGRELLPGRVEAGAPLDRFDQLLTDSTTITGSPAGMLATGLAILVLVAVAAAVRSGVRVPLVQGPAVLAAVATVAGPYLLPGIAA